MALAADVEAGILDWVGAEQPGENLEAAWLRGGTVEAAALSVLRRRRALLGPDTWAVNGDYSQSDRSGAAWLDRQIGRLEAVTGDTGGTTVTTTFMRRCGASR